MKIKENTDPIDVFVISQAYDTRFLLLAMTESQKNIQQYKENLRHRTVNAPENMMEFNETIRYPMGILYLHINKIIDFEVPDNTFVRIKLEPYKIETRHLNKSKFKEDFHQRFYIPIHNHFNVLTLELMFIENEGWFREKHKDITISTISIPLPKLNSLLRKYGGNKIKLPFKIENKKLLQDIKKGKYSKNNEKLEKTEKKEKEAKEGKEEVEKEKYLEIEIQDNTSITSLFEFHLNRNRVENRILNGDYSLKKYQEVVWRLKLFILAFEKFQNTQRILFYHNYPKFSLYCEIFLVIFVYFFRPEMLLSYLLMGLTIMLVLCSPQWKSSMAEKVNNFFFLPKHLNKDIRITDIKTRAFVDEEMTKIKLRNEKKEINEKLQINNIKKQGLFGKYNNFKKGSAKTLDNLEYFVDLFEKFKNLVAWSDDVMTQYFFILVFVLYIFVTFLPLRYITIIYLIRRFYKGKSYYKRRKRSNMRVVEIELEKYLTY